MIKSVLQSISGVEVYPIVALVLFFASFLYMLWRVVRMDKNDVDRDSRLPLDDAIPKGKIMRNRLTGGNR